MKTEKKEFPISVKRGSTIVKIYRLAYKQNGEERYHYRVVYYDANGSRKEKTFADLKEAKTEADTKATELSTGQLDALTLTNRDSALYVRAVETLRPLEVPLDLAVVEYAQAKQLFRGRALIEAVEFFNQHHSQQRPEKTVRQVVDEMVAAKKADNLSKWHIRDLRNRCGAFAEAFKCLVDQVTVANVNDFLRGIQGSGRTRNNYRLAIITLFRYAELQGYIADTAARAIARAAKAKEHQNDIVIYTPEEIAAMLSTADERFLPFLAIAAFAGVRTYEIIRLDWADVDLKAGFITIRPAKAKTASRRIIPILPNLKEWLLPYAKESGRVCAYSGIQRSVGRLTRKMRETQLAFAWKRNALRHSFVTYRVAAIQNVNQVALEAGNSPQMIMKHYRGLVRPAQAEQWFGVLPPPTILLKAA